MRSASKSRKLKKVKKAFRSRFRDVGLTAARTLMVRSLRRDGLHYAMSGRPVVIGFVLANAADADVFKTSIRNLAELVSGKRLAGLIDVLHWDGETPPRRNRDPDSTVAESLAANDFVFGFASRRDDFPPLFRIAADAIVVLPPLDVPALRAAMSNAGFHSIPDAALEDALRIPLRTLGAMTSRARPTRVIEHRLAQAAAHYRGEPAETSLGDTSRGGPSLEDLAGLGEAAVWGLELAVDLRAFQAGELPWADVDRGVLLSGPTGTGKTTFARALARTCNIPIHVHSLARWQSRGYLNDLLSAMRGAFALASADPPCIVFIDELDAIGDRDRLSGRNENYEREVINALLECLDGADQREGVIVVGATNMPDKIDRAILRPGRLGKHIVIPLPDTAARIGILRYYFGNDIPQDSIVDISIRLEGASGAAIEQIARDARRQARSRNSPLWVEDIEKFIPMRLVQGDASFAVTCVHEAGHVVAGYLLGAESGQCFIEGFAVREVKRDGTSGWTVFQREPLLHRTKSSFLAEIAILLAGMASEVACLGACTGSAGGTDESDLHHATLIAARMELSLGLGESLLYTPSPSSDDAFRALANDARLRQRVSDILDGCMKRATDVLTKNAVLLEEIAGLLRRTGVVTAADVRMLRTASKDDLA